MIRRLGFILAIVALVSGAGLLLRAEPPQDVGSWASIGTAPENRIGAAAVALPDGRTLIAGGLADGTPTAAVVVFDPADSSFATAGQLLEPRAGHTATLLEDGRVLIAGGTVNELLTGDLEIFDPSDGSSTLVATLAMLRSGHAAARIGDGKVLIAGGTGTDGVLQTAEIFDPNTGAASLAGSPLTVARTGASATALIDGRVLIAGGNDGNQDLLSAEIYNPSTDSFQATDTNLDAPRSNHTAVLLPHNNSVLIAGGTSDGVPLATADLFLPAQFPDPFTYGMGQFALTGEMAAPRSGAAGGPHIEGYAFVVGGGQPDAEVYRFATIKTDKDDYPPGQTAIITGSGWNANEEVTLLFQEDPAVHADYQLSVTADGDGNIYHDQWAPEEHDANVRFYLMAIGQQSGHRAQMTFTDSVSNVTITATNPLLSVATGGTVSVPYSFTFIAGGGPPPPSAVATTSIKYQVFLRTSGTDYAITPLSAALTVTPSVVTTIPLASVNVTFNGVGGNPPGTAGAGFQLKVTVTPQNGSVTTAQSATSSPANGSEWVKVKPADDTTTEIVSCVPNPVTAGSPTTCTATVTNTLNASGYGWPQGTVDWSQNGGFGLTGSFSGDPCTLVQIGATNASTCSVTFTPAVGSVDGKLRAAYVSSNLNKWNESQRDQFSLAVTSGNTAPSIAANNASVTVNEGAQAINSGTWSDANAGDTVTLSASVGTVIKSGTNASGTWSWSFNTTDGPDQSQTVTITANDGTTTTDTTFALTVNNVAPTVTFSSPTITVDEGPTEVLYSFSISDPGNDTPFTFTGTPSCGANGTLVPLSPSIIGNAGSFKCTFPDGPADTTLSVQVSDADNAPSPAATVDVHVNNVAPTVTFSSPTITVDEGPTEVLYSFSISDPGNDTPFTFTGTPSCGANGTLVPLSPSIVGSAGSFKCTFPDGPADTTLSVQVSDADNAPSLAATVDVHVNNVAPTVTFSSPTTTVNEGPSEILYSFSISDPGNDTPFTFTVPPTCGTGGTVVAGSPTIVGSAGSFKCVFPDGPADTTLSVQVSDADSAPSLAATVDVHVNNVAPTVLISGASNVNEGSLYSLTLGEVTDPGIDSVTSYVVHWGDGSENTYSTDGVKTHAYGDGEPTSYNITVDLVDEDGTFLDRANSLSVLVNNVNPSMTANSFAFNPYTGVANASVSFSDPGWLDEVSATWAGITGTPGALGPGDAPGPLTGTFTATQTFTGCVADAIAVHVSDDDGGYFDHTFAAADSLGTYTAAFLAPIKDGVRNVVKHGNVIPVKVEIRDCHGNLVTNRTLSIVLYAGVSSPADVAEGDLVIASSVSSADSGNTMRLADGHYMYNLATKPLTLGFPYTIWIKDGTMTVATAVITTKK